MKIQKLMGLPLLLLIAGGLFFSCKKVVKNEDYYEAVSKYIYAFTSGDIGRNEAVRVRFVDVAVRPDKIGKAVDPAVFSISPAVKGNAVWDDDRTIVFTPSEPMGYGEKFKGTVAINRIFEKVPSLASSFDFEFRVRQLSFNVNSEGIMAADLADLRKQLIRGTISTSDAVDVKLLEGVLSARQNGKSLPIKWNHNPNGIDHSYTVEAVERTDARSKVVLEWTGDAFGIEQNGKEEIEVPAIDEFYVLDARVMQDDEQYVLINFSDPILADQDLNGLIRVLEYDGDFRFVVDRNMVRAYPSGRIVGEHSVRVEAGVKNIAGAGMKESFDSFLNFEDLKPAVRLVGQGAIIPKNENGQVIFPFDAVGLKAVDVEVFKIYNSSVLQYLQVNEIEGDRELERVGKIILQKKVDLAKLNPDANAHTWQRYALDLSEMIQKDPGAVYQIRMAFRLDYTIQDCANAYEDAELFAKIGMKDDAGRLKSIIGGYQGIYFDPKANQWWWYNDDDEDSDRYRYRNRENACKREYYNRDHFVKRNVFASDLGLLAKRGKDKSVFVAVTDLHTTAPVGEVNLTFYDYQLQEVGKGRTDESGTTIVEDLSVPPFVVVARQGDRRAYLRMADGGTLSLSRFDVSGVEPQKGLKGYLYGERGVWRPGDSLFLNFVLEDKAGLLPPDHPLHFELKDPKGTLRHRYTTSESVNGVYALHCATSMDAPTGNWTAKVKVGGATFSKTLKIETVKPNRLKIKMDFGKERLTSSDRNLKGKLQVNWLHGAPGQNLKSKVEMTLLSTPTTFSNFKDFVFDDPARRIYPDPQVLFNSKVDENGSAEVPLKLSTRGNAPGKLVARFKIRSYEAGGDFSTDNFSMDYYPYDEFVGVSIPTNRWGSKVLNRKGDNVTFVCVDANGKPIAGKKLEVGLYRCDWRWWWDEDAADNVAQFNSADHFNALDRATVTTNSRGIATWKVRPGRWGRFLVRVSNGNEEHAAGDFFWSGYPRGKQDIKARNAAAMLPFSVEKEKYQLGEEVTLKVPASEDGRILLTLENGTRVVKHLWFDAKAGDNLLKFKAEEGMVPTVYAHISLFQPHAQTKNDLPIRMYGVMPVNIENKVTHLTPKIAMQDVIKPGKQFTVNVSEASGLACAYTLAIVDEGLLDLTRFQTPNPWQAFFAREALGVKTWDIFDYVLGAYGAELERILSIGGDAFNRKAQNAAQVNRFKPVVKHVGPFYLEKGQTASHKFTIDNYVGSVRVMAVCSAPKPGGKGAYGSAEKTCPVRQPLMIMPTLPRVLGPNETLRLPVEVFAMEKKVKSANIRVKESSGLVKIAKSSKRLAFEKPGQKLSYFELQVGEKTGVARFTISAEGAGERTTSEIELEVRNPNPYVMELVEGTMKPGESWTGSFDPSRFTDLANATIEVSSLPPVNLHRHLNYLIRYPHGCIEQTTSAAFPQLFVGLLTTMSEKMEQKMATNVKAAINKMQSFQRSDGGFSYWPGGRTVSDWSSTYAGHFLLEAKRKGYKVPQSMLDRWARYQTNNSRKWKRDTRNHQRWYRYDGDMEQAYRLYTLALAGKPAVGDMNRMREMENLHTEAAYLLASAYAQIGKPEQARAICKMSWIKDFKYVWSGRTYGSALRDHALMLETYVAIGDMKNAEREVLYISKIMGGSGGWFWNTQSLSTALRALSRYAEKGSSSFAGPVYTLKTGSNAASNGPREHLISSVDITQTIANSGKVQLTNKDEVTLYARLAVNGRPLAGEETAASKNVAISIRYTDLKGKDIDVRQLKQGTDFIAEVTISRKGGGLNIPYKDLALTQVFPSGWEILNSRMGTSMGNVSNSPMDFQDIRDDRVLTYFALPRQRWDYRSRRYLSDKGVYRIQLNAAYTGKYYLPAVDCQAMYDERVHANTVGKWVEVI